MARVEGRMSVREEKEIDWEMEGRGREREGCGDKREKWRERWGREGF